MKRRDVMIGTGGVAVALLAGRVPTVQAQESSAELFDLVPAPAALDEEYYELVYANLADVDEEAELGFQTRVVAEIDDLAVEDVEEVVTGRLADFDVVGSLAGEFDRPEPGEEVDERDDWRVGDDGDAGLAVASTDDLVAFATGDEDDRIGRVETAVDAAAGDVESVTEAVAFVATTFDRLSGHDVVFYVGEVETGFPGRAGEKLEAFGAGFEEHPADIRGADGEMEHEYVFEPADDVDLDAELVEEFVEEIEPGKILELEADVEDDLGVAETVVEAPPRRDRNAAPDARVRMDADPDAGTATFEHGGGEAVPLDELELWVNGDPADVQPADELPGDTFEADESFTVGTGPLASVVLRWEDEEENVYYDYVSDTVGEETFEVDYDVETATVEMTYTGEATADPASLVLEHVRRVEDGDTVRLEREGLEEPLGALGDELEEGDAVVVDGVDVEDRVELALDVGSGPPGATVPRATLVRFEVRPPRVFVGRRPGEGPTIEFRTHGPGDAHDTYDAEEFRLLVDGEEADVQPADEFDALAGDVLELDPVPFGTELVVEWTEPEEPYVVEEHVVEPRGWVESTYDDADGTLALAYADGDAVDADDLELRVDGEPADTRPADDHDVFEPGDEVALSVEPFALVDLVWVGEDVESTLATVVTGQELFEATYDPDDDAVELVYTGAQEADPERIAVERFGHRSDGDGDLFAAEHDALTDGDSVTVEDVEPDTAVRVVLHGEADERGYTPTHVLFRFRPQPSFAFSFENRDGDVVAVYRDEGDRDAEEFRILADGVETDVQPADEHDTLEAGDELDLGSFPAGTELVVEWTVPDDPVEIQRHQVVPDVEFEAEYDEDEALVTVEHAGGDEVDADDLGVYVEPVTDGLADWDGEGRVSEGDSTTLDVETEPEILLVVYRERDVLYETRFESR